MQLQRFIDYLLHSYCIDQNLTVPKTFPKNRIMKLNSSFITFIMVAFVYHFQVKALPSPKNDPDSEPSDINAIDSEETDEVN